LGWPELNTFAQIRNEAMRLGVEFPPEALSGNGRDFGILDALDAKLILRVVKLALTERRRRTK
jgi:hypothetical protein